MVSDSGNNVSKPTTIPAGSPIINSSSSTSLNLILNWYLGSAIVLVLIIYHSVVKNEFVYDDIPYIQENYQITSLKYLPSIFVSSYPPDSKHQGLYRPILTLSYLIDYHIWGGANPLGFHLTNLMLYLGCVIFFWLFMVELINNPVGAFIATLLFATHPIHTESVNWAVGRCAVLSTLFLLVSFYSYIFWRKSIISNAKTLRSVYLILSLLFYFLALGSYEIVIVYPVLLLLYEYFIARSRIGKFPVKSLLTQFYLPLLGVIILYLSLRIIALEGIGPRGEHVFFADKSFFQRLELVPAIYVLNLFLLLFPFRLTTIYDIKIEPHLFPLSSTFSMILFLVLCVALIWLIYKKYSLPAFGLLWVLLSILPVSNIIPLGMITSERALFFPSVGFCIMLGGIAGLFIRPVRQLLKIEQNLYVLGLVAVVVVFYTIRSIDRTRDWRTPFTFWNSELAMHPNSGAAHNSLGWYFYNIGDRTQAKKEFLCAIECEPERKRAYYNLIKVLIEERNFKQAREMLNKVAKLGPGPMGSNFATIGTLYMELNDTETAEEFYRKAVEVYPRNSTALFELGNFALQKKQPLKAIEYLTRALDESPVPFRGGIYNSRGVALLALGNPEGAIKDFHKAIACNPNLEKPYLQLAEIYLGKKEYPAAEKILTLAIQNAKPLSPMPFMYLVKCLSAQKRYDDALRIANKWQTKFPEHLQVYLAQAQLYVAKRDGDSAVAVLRQALQLNPKFAPAYELLGDICYLARKKPEAKHFWEKALSLQPDTQRIIKKIAKIDQPTTDTKINISE